MYQSEITPAHRTLKPAEFSVTQLQNGTLHADRTVIDLGPIRIAKRDFSLAFRAKGEVAPATYLIGLTDGTAKALWSGVPVESGDLATTRGPIDLCTTGAASFYTLTIVEGFPWLDVDDKVAQVRMRSGVSRLRLFLRELFAAGHAVSKTPKYVIEEIVNVLTTIDGTSAVGPNRSQSRRIRAVRECQAYVAEHMGNRVTLFDLSEISGMRPRSLINAFEALTGLSPMAFLRAERLNRVKETLRSAGPHAPRVIDVATEWGFWHMGHFAMAYRSMFGESPSETLRHVPPSRSRS
ncbi:MAG TPA: helix-turn-helix domain-containing protein [Candidatus Baltobacteraceae bacterium]|nr:helix-turn-helix domain-containing protein [Candidatus Baltobacteraceae bacterium]